VAKKVDALDERGEELFDLVSGATSNTRVDGIAIGTVVALSEAGEPLVEFSGNLRSGPIAAQTVTPVHLEHVGREVALMFEGGNPSSPIVLGLIQIPGARPTVEAQVDQNRVVIEAESEIELRCGDASILLSRDGKIRIRGKDLLSRSSGGNRIKGGSVRIN
jgi:hypothetical protein